MPWTNFDSEIQTMVQNHNYPDITEGDYFSDYAQQGLLYPASQVLSNPGELLPVFKKQGTYNGVQYGMPFTTSTRTLFYNKKLFAKAGISSARRRPGPTSRPTRPRSRRRARSASACRSVPRRRRPSRCCGSSATAATTRTRRGKWTINSPQNVAAFNFLKGLVSAGDTEPHPGTQNRTPLWEQFAQGKIGMINGSPALIPIIQSAGVLKRLGLGLGADRRQERPADQDARRV